MEQAILPISFHLNDCGMSWRSFTGQETSVSSFAAVKKEDRSSALSTALKTEFAEQLSDECLAHWLNYKKEKPAAKALFVTARIEDARRCMGYLETLGIPSLLATSHDGKACTENIAKFKGRSPVLVTIAVAYEGLDVPPVSHVCVLTRIRSSEWLEQCVSRATRVDKESGPYRSQMAHIFAPKDPAFLEFVEIIKKEQVTRAQPAAQKEEQLALFPLEEESGGGCDQGPCIPLKSQILELSKKIIGNIHRTPDPIVLTPKQKELSLRRQIDRHLKAYAQAQGYEYPQIMRDVKRIFDGKPRGDLTLDELQYLWDRVQQVYPLADQGRYVPLSNCPPVFKTTDHAEFNVFEENFF
jgi:superfamily II DNA or RNA helicase